MLKVETVLDVTSSSEVSYVIGAGDHRAAVHQETLKIDRRENDHCSPSFSQPWCLGHPTFLYFTPWSSCNDLETLLAYNYKRNL